MAFDPTQLPAGLPVPEDDGAAAHLAGLGMPPIALPSTSGEPMRVDTMPDGFSPGPLRLPDDRAARRHAARRLG